MFLQPSTTPGTWPVLSKCGWMKDCQPLAFFLMGHGCWERPRPEIMRRHNLMATVKIMEVLYEWVIWSSVGKDSSSSQISAVTLQKEIKTCLDDKGHLGIKMPNTVRVWCCQRAVGKTVWITEESIFRILHRGSERCVKHLGFDFTFQCFLFCSCICCHWVRKNVQVFVFF